MNLRARLPGAIGPVPNQIASLHDQIRILEFDPGFFSTRLDIHELHPVQRRFLRQRSQHTQQGGRHNQSSPCRIEGLTSFEHADGESGAGQQLGGIQTAGRAADDRNVILHGFPIPPFG